MSTMNKEQRRAWRSTIPLDLTYEGAGVHADTRVSDISVTGAYIDTMTPLPLGSNLELTITLPDGHVIRVGSVVVHSHPQTGMGVEFAGLTPEDSRRIRRFIRA